MVEIPIFSTSTNDCKDSLCKSTNLIDLWAHGYHFCLNNSNMIYRTIGVTLSDTYKIIIYKTIRVLYFIFWFIWISWPSKRVLQLNFLSLFYVIQNIKSQLRQKKSIWSNSTRKYLIWHKLYKCLMLMLL